MAISKEFPGWAQLNFLQRPWTLAVGYILWPSVGGKGISSVHRDIVMTFLLAIQEGFHQPPGIHSGLWSHHDSLLPNAYVALGLSTFLQWWCLTLPHEFWLLQHLGIWWGNLLNNFQPCPTCSLEPSKVIFPPKNISHHYIGISPPRQLQPSDPMRPCSKCQGEGRTSPAPTLSEQLEVGHETTWVS